MDYTIDRDAFAEVLLGLSTDLRANAKLLGAPSAVTDHMMKSLLENVNGGKLFRGRSVPEAGTVLLGRPLASNEFRNLSILGWLVEMLQGYFLVLDDIMDGSMTRRGKPCWYKRPEVGFIAVNDACALKSGIFFLLKKYFRDHPSYVDMLESIEEISYMTEIGQTCDSLASMEKDPTNWTWKQYNTIAMFKSGYYSFYLSALLALQYLGLASSLNIKHTKQILLELGTFYQVQNDFLDICALSMRTGKVGTDIMENKCSWVILKALEVCDNEQRVYLKENYGKGTIDTARQVQSVLLSLPLKSLYEQEESDFKANFGRMINETSEDEGLQRAMYWRLYSCIEWCNHYQAG